MMSAAQVPAALDPPGRSDGPGSSATAPYRRVVAMTARRSSAQAEDVEAGVHEQYVPGDATRQIRA